MLTSEEKNKIIKNYKLHNTDTGSAEVQIAILSEEIKKLTLHLKKQQRPSFKKRFIKNGNEKKKIIKLLKKRRY